MASYLVLKRLVEDRVYEEGEVVTSPSFADSVPILLSRHYLAVVPDNYSPPAAPKLKSEPPAPAPAPEDPEHSGGADSPQATGGTTPEAEPPASGVAPEPEAPSLPEVIDLSDVPTPVEETKAS